jgi:cytidylate kinase
VTRPSDRLIIAIDGPAGAGKSTVARQVAHRLGYLYLDTGAMYRAVALKALRQQLGLSDADALALAADQAQIRLETQDGATRVWLDGDEVTHDIRTPEVTEAASRVSAQPRVREALVKQQRACGAAGGVVMEGRDIGTVVFPDADLKIFLDASPDERTRRRVADLAAQGIPATAETVGRQMAERDTRDSHRAASPLVRAPDAVLIETDGITAEEVVQRIFDLCRARGAVA